MKEIYEIQERKPGTETAKGYWKVLHDYNDCDLEEAKACVKALRFKWKEEKREYRVVKVTRELTEL